MNSTCNWRKGLHGNVQYSGFLTCSPLAVFNNSQSKQNYRHLLANPVALRSWKLDQQCLSVKYCPKIRHSRESGSVWVWGGCCLFDSFIFRVCFMLRFYVPLLRKTKPVTSEFLLTGQNKPNNYNKIHTFVPGSTWVSSAATAVPTRQAGRQLPGGVFPGCTSSAHTQTDFSFAPSGGAQETKAGLSPAGRSPRWCSQKTTRTFSAALSLGSRKRIFKMLKPSTE